MKASLEETYPILSYDKCVALMETVCDPQAGRPVYGPHTRLVQGWDVHGATYAIRYHETDVVTYHADGTVTLNAGNRRTQGARNRFTYYCPFVLSNEKGKWVVWSGRRWIPFRNGMRLRPPGSEQEPDNSHTSCSRRGRRLRNPDCPAEVVRQF
jgi:hypothetical protein